MMICIREILAVTVVYANINYISHPLGFVFLFANVSGLTHGPMVPKKLLFPL